MTVTRFPRAPASPAALAEASFLVDIRNARIVAAGAVAAALLDWEAARSAKRALDMAMPALRVLRAFAKSGHSGTNETQRLIFWSRRGVVGAQGRVEAVESGAHAGTLRVTLTNATELLAQSTLAAAARAQITPAKSDHNELPMAMGSNVEFRDSALSWGRKAAIASADDPTGPTDDRATLQLIARRIQEGIRLHGPADGPTGVDDEPRAPASDMPDIDVASDNWKPVGGRTPLTPEANDNAVPPGEAAPVASDAAKAVVENIQATEPDLEDPHSLSALAALFAKTAHDIKTPLSAISAASEIIRDERLGPSGNERYRAYAADIHASARHALAIVDRLMKMPQGLGEASVEGRVNSAMPNADPETKVHTGRPALTPERVDLNALMSQCAAELRPLMDVQNLRLSVRLDPSVPPVSLDSIGLKQSVLNILTNAMKFTPADGTIALETDALPNGARITVRDSGRGMTKGAIARHSGGDATDAAPSGPTATGLGLGLAQVRTFCRENGGTLDLDSTLGKGTSVSLTFKSETR